MIVDGYDTTTWDYVGPCPACGTDHGGGLGPGTLSGDMACLEEQLRALVASLRPWLRWPVALVGRLLIAVRWVRHPGGR